jgi:hypothetical protein
LPIFTFARRRFLMASFTRKPLVLRGVTVVRGGQTAWLRPARAGVADLGTPAFPISLRHSSTGNPDMANPEARHDSAAERAGRSERLAGVLYRRSPALRARLTSGRLQVLATQSFCGGGLSLPAAQRTDKRCTGTPTGRTSVGGTRSAASTRGKED